MRKFQVNLKATTCATATVEIEDERLQEIATDFEVSVEQLTMYDLRDEIVELAHHTIPQLCNYCSGGGFDAEFTRDEDSEWELDDDGDLTEVAADE